MRSNRNLVTTSLISCVCILAANCSPGNDTNTGGGGSATTSGTTTTSSSSSSTTSTSGTGGAPPACDGGHLDPAFTWYGTNREQVDKMLDERGCKSASYDPKKPPIAIFDWDNTVIKNDIGDGTTFWMFEHDLVRQPAGKDWSTTSKYLTAEARADLNTYCDALADAGQLLPTSGTGAANVACANAIFNIYLNGVTITVDPATSKPYPAWSGFAPRRIEPGYLWAGQLQAGYTPAEVKAFATQAIQANLGNAIDTKQDIGGNSANYWIRIYDQMKDLIAKLGSNGFDVWIVSASPEPVVQVFGEMVGVPNDHVVGLRLTVDGSGKLTSTPAKCGGADAITYIDGKRCWTNQEILKVKGDPFAVAPAADRQVFGAGDSATDVAFVRDATVMSLVLNRNKKELMCYAYHDLNVKKTGKWLVNPMFIQGKAKQTSLYPCSTTACIDDNGVGVPCLDEQGQPIPDQEDTVFAQ